MSRSRLLTCSTISIFFRSSVANPHTFHDPILSLFFVLLSSLVLPVPSPLSLRVSLPSLSLAFFQVPFLFLSSCSTHLCFSHILFGPLAFSCLSLPSLTLELRLSFVIPLLAIHTLHPSLLTHANTFSVSILCHSMLALRFSVIIRKCSPSRSTFPIAKQYSPTSSHFFLLNSIFVTSLGTPNISTISTLPYQSFLRYPPCLTVFFLISSEKISGVLYSQCRWETCKLLGFPNPSTCWGSGVFQFFPGAPH